MPLASDKLIRRHITPGEWLAEKLREVEHVEVIERIEGDEYAPETVRVRAEMGHVPNAATNLIESVGASINPVTLRIDGGLRFDISVSEYRKEGARELRKYGSSTSVTLPPGALESSGLDVPDRVVVLARPDSILLVSEGMGSGETSSEPETLPEREMLTDGAENE